MSHQNVTIEFINHAVPNVMRQFFVPALFALSSLLLAGCANTPTASTANTEVPNATGISLRFIGEAIVPHRMDAVSYTHLTLPTILRV